MFTCDVLLILRWRNEVLGNFRKIKGQEENCAARDVNEPPEAVSREDIIL